MPRDRNRPRLGRGLASLIRDSSEPLETQSSYVSASPHETPAAEDAHTASSPPHRWPQLVPIDSVVANPAQPRRHFEPEALSQLAESIRTHGLLQPILVSALSDGEAGQRYQLIAGERRLRAATQSGMTEIPCIIRPAEPRESLELALIENIHRADLNPVERAAAYRDLMDRFGLTQQELAERVGEQRASIANYIRILDLCDSVRDMVAAGTLTFGHARALAGLGGREGAQDALARRIIEQRLSVRQAEKLVQDLQNGAAETRMDKPAPRAKSPWLSDVERQLAQSVGTRVAIRPGRGKHTGRIVIDYYSLDDFDRIVGVLGAQIES